MNDSRMVFRAQDESGDEAWVEDADKSLCLFVSNFEQVLSRKDVERLAETLNGWLAKK